MTNEVAKSDYLMPLSWPRSGDVTGPSIAGGDDLHRWQAEAILGIQPNSRRARWRVRSGGAFRVSLCWIVDSVICGLAHAGCAHGSVTPDLLEILLPEDRHQ